MILLLSALLAVGDTVVAGPRPFPTLPPIEPPALAVPLRPIPAGAIPQVVEYSDGYATRARIHKIASYATLPIFLAEYLSGSALYDNPDDPPDWARSIHGPVAGTLGALFVVNSVTGAWNWWEGRKDPEGRGRRTLHTALMLAADLGFAIAGATGGELEDEGEGGGGSRSTHRTIALSSLGVALGGYLIMSWPLRRD